ncbi:hypothetical protein Syun_021166 [Stephania yunnanensis]|uniref:Uncharacterized protein n=1 Tax=Stephania yunnanensis TaxID=152371 RepID=A0AAP0NQG4_9MAGN
MREESDFCETMREEEKGDAHKLFDNFVQIDMLVEIKRTIPKGSVRSKDFKTKKIFVGGVPTAVSRRLTTTVMSFASFGSRSLFRVAGPRTPGLGGRLGGYGGYSGGSELDGGYGGFGGSGLGAYRDNQQLQSELNGRRGSCTVASSSFNQQQAASSSYSSSKYHSSITAVPTVTPQRHNNNKTSFLSQFCLLLVHTHLLLPSDGESEMLQSCVIVII